MSTSEYTELRFEQLSAEHDREGFSCGLEPLDKYFRQQARQDARKRVAVVFVLTPDGRTVAGFYTLSQHAIELSTVEPEIARKLPKYPDLPATLIGRLAVNVAYQGKGFGERLLMDALQRCLSGSKEVASAAVVVDAKDEQAASFYRKYGFIAIGSTPGRMFILMETIEQLVR